MSHYTIRFSGGRRRRWSPNMVTVRVCWKLKTSWKSAVFTKKVGKNSRYLVGVFNKKNYSTRYAPRLRARNQLFRSGASWRLTENFWSPDRKFWSPTYFIYNLHKNTILYVTLHARKVATEELKQLETTRVTRLAFLDAFRCRQTTPCLAQASARISHPTCTRGIIVK